jgi:hypothetical protein
MSARFCAETTVASLAMNKRSGDPPQLERSRSAQKIIPMVEEESGLDRTPNKRADMLISNIPVDTIERFSRLTVKFCFKRSPE